MWTSKVFCELKKTSYPKWRNLVLFYVWEDAKVWACWNHSFDILLSYLGLVSWVFTFWVSSGLNLGHGCSLMPALLFSHSVVSDSLQPRGLQHTRLPCPLPSPTACSNSCPLSQWCHPTTSSSVILFSSHLQSFPASGSFLMSQLFASGGQSIGASASAPAPPMNIQDGFPSGLTG